MLKVSINYFKMSKMYGSISQNMFPMSNYETHFKIPHCDTNIAETVF
jgi:hypothetical protein